jgi:hypothetical protein
MKVVVKASTSVDNTVIPEGNRYADIEMSFGG